MLPGFKSFRKKERDSSYVAGKCHTWQPTLPPLLDLKREREALRPEMFTTA